MKREGEIKNMIALLSHLYCSPSGAVKRLLKSALNQVEGLVFN